MTWLEIILLGLVGLLAGGLIGALMEVQTLHSRMWRRWMTEVRLKRNLEVERAARAQDLAAYQRRVDRWRRYAIELQDAALSLGIMAPWKAAADRHAAPFVDSDHAPL
jgi:hypothetical protein